MNLNVFLIKPCFSVRRDGQTRLKYSVPIQIYGFRKLQILRQNKNNVMYIIGLFHIFVALERVNVPLKKIQSNMYI